MPSDCFESFPFPIGLSELTQTDSADRNFPRESALEEAGREYYEYRAALMIQYGEGLTKTYNRFHDPDELSPEIGKLRQLHFLMDKTVLESYGWKDLAGTESCEFLLDYDDGEDESEQPVGRSRKKPWRYRWPDEFRDEVLARLLKLNEKRSVEERRSCASAQKKVPGRATRKKSTTKVASKPTPLLDRDGG